MGDPICKWRAARPHNVVELVNDILPHEEMPENDFYDIVDNRMPGFMHTPYQLAAQLGLYAVVDGTYYPRFKIDIDDEYGEELNAISNSMSQIDSMNKITPKPEKTFSDILEEILMFYSLVIQVQQNLNF